MDAEYLKVNVGETLATGLAAVVMSNPPDPVDFLAKWLLNHVENVKKSDAAKAASLAQRKKDEQDEMARLAVYEAEQQAQQEKVEAEQNKHKTVEGLLKNAKANEGLMEQYVQRMKVATGCSSVYAGLLEDNAVKYVAVSEGQEFLLGKKLEKGGEGDGDGEEKKVPITFQLFVEEEEKEEEKEPEPDEDPENPKPKKVKEPTVKSVSVPNVLMGPGSANMHFWRLPQSGAYYAVKVNYASALTDDLLEQAVTKEDELEHEESAKPKEREENDESEENRPVLTAEQKAEQEKAQAEAKATAMELALLSSMKLKDVVYAIGFDTLGQSKRFSTRQLQFITKYSLELIDTLVRLDRMFFKEERKRRRELRKFTQDWFLRRHEDEEGDLTSKLQKQGRPSTAEDVKFLSRQHLMSGNFTRSILEHKKFEVLKGPVKVVEAFLLLLGYEQKDLQMLNEPNWRKMRALLDDALFERIRLHNPRNLDNKTVDAEKIGSMVDDVQFEDLKDRNAILAEMLGFVHDSVALTKQAKKEAEEAAEQKRLEAEAAEAERKEEEARREKEIEDEENRRKEAEAAAQNGASAE